jgi:peptide methionine sulfoxide reductase MsrA
MLNLTILDKTKLHLLDQHARNNIVSLDDLYKILDKIIPPVGENREFVTDLSNGYRVVYSIENQPKGLVRHVSTSIKEQKRPSVEKTKEIAKILGFELSEKMTEKKWFIIDEQIDKDRISINIIEILK